MWQGWHRVGAPMRDRYTRFVELSNTGARQLGFADAGAMWRSGYDMPPERFAAEIDRLWTEVRPLYLSLHAHFLAAVQLMVYAGAVVVLFVFVIMLIGPVEIPSGETRGLMSKSLALVLMAILTATVSLTLLGVTPARGTIECVTGSNGDCAMFGGVQGLGDELFRHGVVPFELISILLTVAIVGAIAVARGRTSKETADAAARGGRS